MESQLLTSWQPGSENREEYNLEILLEGHASNDLKYSLNTSSSGFNQLAVMPR
jgi:hypothetical protein